IAGGANQGVIAAAKEAQAYVLWFDTNGSELAPGTVLASAVTRQDIAAEFWGNLWIKGNMTPGESRKVGIVDGYIDFPIDGKLFKKHIPDSIRTEMKNLIDRMKSGSLSLRSLDG
ncbi:MAG: BMP family ABC transporter substrate-binding protein, partial [Spirochaetaceae bacterium]|nr:BMP family ABC transporter substrate-binding protein [Spirochaetaceae bacterium]